MAALLAVRRSAGNAAVGRLLARQTGDTGPVRPPATAYGYDAYPGNHIDRRVPVETFRLLFEDYSIAADVVIPGDGTTGPRRVERPVRL